MAKKEKVLEVKTSPTSNAVVTPSKSKFNFKTILIVVLVILLLASLSGLAFGYYYFTNQGAGSTKTKDEEISKLKDEITGLESEINDLQGDDLGNDADSNTDAPNTEENPLILNYAEYSAEFYDNIDTADNYQFAYKAGDIVEVTVTPQDGLDISVLVKDPNYSEVSDPINKDGTGKAEVYTYTSDSLYDSGSISFAVRPVQAQVGTYKIKITKTSQDDAGGKEAPTSSESGLEVKTGTYTGNLGEDDSGDYFFVRMKANDRVTIKVEPVKKTDHNYAIRFDETKIGNIYLEANGLEYIPDLLNSNAQGAAESITIFSGSKVSQDDTGILTFGVLNYGTNEGISEYKMTINVFR